MEQAAEWPNEIFSSFHLGLPGFHCSRWQGTLTPWMPAQSKLPLAHAPTCNFPLADTVESHLSTPPGGSQAPCRARHPWMYLCDLRSMGGVQNRCFEKRVCVCVLREPKSSGTTRRYRSTEMLRVKYLYGDCYKDIIKFAHPDKMLHFHTSIFVSNVLCRMTYTYR